MTYRMMGGSRRAASRGPPIRGFRTFKQPPGDVSRDPRHRNVPHRGAWCVPGPRRRPPAHYGKGGRHDMNLGGFIDTFKDGAPRHAA